MEDQEQLDPFIMKDVIARAFDESIRAKRAFLRDNLNTLTQVISAIADGFRRGNKLLLFGNGGSAADAQHIAAEFVNRFRIERPEVFAKQIKALGNQGDIAMAISTSGNAANVLTAVDICRQLKIITVGLTGGTGGQLRGRVDYVLQVSDSQNTARIQETHILVAHVICEIVDRVLFPNA
jgi:D-sedoheptulose 7-phosphate isomerase